MPLWYEEILYFFKTNCLFYIVCFKSVVSFDVLSTWIVIILLSFFFQHSCFTNIYHALP